MNNNTYYANASALRQQLNYKIFKVSSFPFSCYFFHPHKNSVDWDEDFRNINSSNDTINSNDMQFVKKSLMELGYICIDDLNPTTKHLHEVRFHNRQRGESNE